MHVCPTTPVRLQRDTLKADTTLRQCSVLTWPEYEATCAAGEGGNGSNGSLLEAAATNCVVM